MWICHHNSFFPCSTASLWSLCAVCSLIKGNSCFLWLASIGYSQENHCYITWMTSGPLVPWLGVDTMALEAHFSNSIVLFGGYGMRWGKAWVRSLTTPLNVSLASNCPAALGWYLTLSWGRKEGSYQTKISDETFPNAPSSSWVSISSTLQERERGLLGGPVG